MKNSITHISVVIPTRNRPHDVQRCLDGLTRVNYPSWDVLLVDQSEDTRTQMIADRFTSLLPCLLYCRMREAGLSRARNIGIAKTDGDIVAFLDDDCTVTADWLDQVANVFARHPHAALVFGAVKSVPHDWRSHFIPIYRVNEERVLRGRTALVRSSGIGASMYLRRSLSQSAGPFDPHLGSGARFFRSSEDWEYCYRVLATGNEAVLTPSIVVHHFGMRDYKSGAVSRLFRESAYSDGAVDMKLLRCRDAAALALIVAHTWGYISKINLRNLVLRRSPNGLAWIVMYICGLLASFQLGVDRHRRLYVTATDCPTHQ